MVLRRSAILLLLLAAGSTSAASQPPVVRDSAGVRIVQNGARSRAPVVLRVGTTVVSDNHNRRFSVVDRSGRIVRTFTANESRMPPSSASDDPRVRITEAVAEQRRNATFRPLGGAAQRSAMQERMRATPYPETWPTAGYTWLRTAHSGSGTTRYPFPHRTSGRPSIPPVACLADCRFPVRQQVTLRWR